MRTATIKRDYMVHLYLLMRLNRRITNMTPHTITFKDTLVIYLANC